MLAPFQEKKKTKRKKKNKVKKNHCGDVCSASAAFFPSGVFLCFLFFVHFLKLTEIVH